jgi:hypothetical protein
MRHAIINAIQNGLSHRLPSRSSDSRDALIERLTVIDLFLVEGRKYNQTYQLICMLDGRLTDRSCYVKWGVV